MLASSMNRRRFLQGSAFALYSPYPQDDYVTVRPPGAASAAVAGAVVVHGGGWRAGALQHSCPQDVCSGLAAAGILCVNIDYRTTDIVGWPGQLQDVQRA